MGRGVLGTDCGLGDDMSLERKDSADDDLRSPDGCISDCDASVLRLVADASNISMDASRLSPEVCKAISACRRSNPIDSKVLSAAADIEPI